MQLCKPDPVSLWFIALPGIILGVAVHILLMGNFVDLPPAEMSGLALVVAIALPATLASLGKTAGVGQWFGLCAIMTVVIVAGSLAAALTALLFYPFFITIDPPYLAGIIQGLPGLAAALFMLWAIHKSAGHSSPWAWFSDEV